MTVVPVQYKVCRYFQVYEQRSRLPIPEMNHLHKERNEYTANPSSTPNTKRIPLLAKIYVKMRRSIMRMKNNPRITCPRNIFIVKLGYTIFLIFCQKHRLWVLVRTALARRFERVPTTYVFDQKYFKSIIFSPQRFLFFKSLYIAWARKSTCY